MESTVLKYNIIKDIPGVSKFDLAVCLANEVFCRLPEEPEYEAGAIISQGQVCDDETDEVVFDGTTIGFYSTASEEDCMILVNWFQHEMNEVVGGQMPDGIKVVPIDIYYNYTGLRTPHSFFSTVYPGDIMIGYNKNNVNGCYEMQFGITELTNSRTDT
jgi:hypothetical protein